MVAERVDKTTHWPMPTLMYAILGIIQNPRGCGPCQCEKGQGSWITCPSKSCPCRWLKYHLEGDHFPFQISHSAYSGTVPRLETMEVSCGHTCDFHISCIQAPYSLRTPLFRHHRPRFTVLDSTWSECTPYRCMIRELSY